jgi:hypothetical protein
VGAVSEESFVPASDCVNGGVYRLVSSSGAETGVFVSSSKQFIVMDRSSTPPRLAAEHHVDNSSSYGKVKPQELMGVLAEDVPLRLSLGATCHNCDMEVRFTAVEPVKGLGFWDHFAPSACEDVAPVPVANMKLLVALESLGRAASAT